MLSRYIKKPHAINRMTHNYFSYIFKCYVSHLHEHGYKPQTIKRYCQAIEHLGQWLEGEKISKICIDKTDISNFLKNHLPKCKCLLPKATEVKTIRAAINQLLKVTYKGKNILSFSRNKISKADKIVKDFDKYLLDICGAAENTRISRKRYVFVLNDCFLL